MEYITPLLQLNALTIILSSAILLLLILSFKFRVYFFYFIVFGAFSGTMTILLFMFYPWHNITMILLLSAIIALHCALMFFVPPTTVGRIQKKKELKRKKKEMIKAEAELKARQDYYRSQNKKD